MDSHERFLQRIEFGGNFTDLISQICTAYGIGTYRSHNIPTLGYEDLNAVIETEQGKYFAKLFSSFRSLEDCKRYIEVVERVLEAGVNHPVLYKSPQGYLHQIKEAGSEVRLCLMEYIDGETLYELGEKPSLEEGQFLIQQATLINGIDHKPSFIYDSWAVSNFPAEFDKKKGALEVEDKEAITPLVEQFKDLSIDRLPHSFVHGDIIATNVMKDKQGKLYIIDFSVSNYYPRIQELTVLLCDLFFDQESPDRFLDKYKWAVNEYQKQITLTPKELKALPLFAKVAHAMHIIGASYERSQGNSGEENNSWLELGRKGLKLSQTS